MPMVKVLKPVNGAVNIKIDNIWAARVDFSSPKPGAIALIIDVENNEPRIATNNKINTVIRMKVPTSAQAFSSPSFTSVSMNIGIKTKDKFQNITI